jgi:hypothetical protein
LDSKRIKLSLNFFFSKTGTFDKWKQFWVKGLVIWCLTPLSIIYQLHRGDTQRKPQTCRKSLTKKLYHIMLYRVHLAWTEFELTTFVVIGTDCIGSWRSNHHTSMTTTARLSKGYDMHVWSDKKHGVSVSYRLNHFAKQLKEKAKGNKGVFRSLTSWDRPYNGQQKINEKSKLWSEKHYYTDNKRLKNAIPTSKQDKLIC